MRKLFRVLATIGIIASVVCGQVTWNNNTPPTITNGTTVTIAAGAEGTMDVPENTTVTIVSAGNETVNNGDRRISLNIPATSKVIWQARYTNSTSAPDWRTDSTWTIGGAVIISADDGEFEVVDGAKIINTDNDIAINRVGVGGQITVSGGIVHSDRGTAIQNNSWSNAIVTISGGVVSNNSATANVIFVPTTSWGEDNSELNIIGGLIIAPRGNMNSGPEGILNRAHTGELGGVIIALPTVSTYFSGSITNGGKEFLSFLPNNAPVSWNFENNLITGVKYNADGDVFPFTMTEINATNEFVWNGDGDNIDIPLGIESVTVTIAAGANGTLSIPANATVAIVSAGNESVDNADRRIALNIPATSKVIWQARYTNSATWDWTVSGEGTIRIFGSGEFEVVDGAKIISAGDDIAITRNTAGRLTVSGGIIHSATGGAIQQNFDCSNNIVTISGGVVGSNSNWFAVIGIGWGDNSVLNITGGLIIGQRENIQGILGRAHTGELGGTIVAYTAEAAVGTHNAGDRTGLVSLPENSASWELNSEQGGGISYPGGFFPIATVTVNPSQNSIFRRINTDTRFGILLENAIVSDFARISVITPEPATINLRIMDALGNVVFTETAVGANHHLPIIWNLQNQSGRFVANGTYLIIAEATGISGRRFTYSARIGVSR
ncbi:MAG: hypothetical protein FWE23_06385 [Chitinivibrionia bacterium]|nr:hypothetical protein [Chitinivibrionia bacterium]